MLTIRYCEGRERADAIKALFRRNGNVHFDHSWDVSYPATDARSWVAEDANGTVVMHVALFPCTIGDGARTWRGGLLGDLMADPDHRDFFGPVQLMRQVVADARAAFDLLYSDPTPVSAGVLRAAGFAPFGTLRRYVMPASWLWTALGSVRAGPALNLVSDRAVDDADVAGALERMRASPPVRVRRVPGTYLSRVGGEMLGVGRWLWLESPGSNGTPAALVLASLRPEERRLNIVDVVWDSARTALAPALLAAARWARSAGMAWVELLALETTDAELQARRAGFIARADAQPIVFQALGGDPLPPVRDWYLGRLDGSAW